MILKSLIDKDAMLACGTPLPNIRAVDFPGGCGCVGSLDRGGIPFDGIPLTVDRHHGNRDADGHDGNRGYGEEDEEDLVHGSPFLDF